MPATQSLMSSFNGGLKTEYTGLNFPENACTDMSNCVISLIGEISRREGIDFEANAVQTPYDMANVAINYYLWKNAGGDGQTQILALQVGNQIHFYLTSAATAGAPVSAQALGSAPVFIPAFQATGNTGNIAQTECQFSDGNGYLFVYHPYCDPFYCTYMSGSILANVIDLQIRDFNGIYEQGITVNFRPLTLTAEHQYNLSNQGWTTGAPWSGIDQTGHSIVAAMGPMSFTIGTGLTIPNGTLVKVGLYQYSFEYPLVTSWNNWYDPALTGSVTSYNSGSGVITISCNFVFPSIVNQSFFLSATPGQWQAILSPYAIGYISTWFSAEGNYPSNADIWYEFKDSSGNFDPTTTEPNVSVGSGQSPQGHFIFSPFQQYRTLVSGIAGLTNVSTTNRPRTGIFWSGRVWYAGVDASQAALGDQIFQTWTENIYFSQIVESPVDFGSCYQVNDPTDETLNALLPSDGGVITIQGCGGIHKLFSLQNGLLVFATNGIWLIAGNGGLGFTADSYSINKISSVQVLTGTSFIDVLGYPMFWNEEGIYTVKTNKEASPYQFAGFEVEPLTVGTILSFYNNIPKDSKKFARGTYDPISYVVQWVYRSTQETGIQNRYQFDSALTLNVFNRAFYPYTIASNNACYVSGVQYIYYPNSLNSPDPSIKYLTTVNNTNITFSEERDTNWIDFFSYDKVGVDYDSFFTTGYNLHGKGLLKWTNNYIYMYADNGSPYAYTIQAIWDYANTGNSGRYSNLQTVTNFNPNYNKIYRRHKLRGHGMAMQINVGSVSGQPFQFFGWGMHDDVDQGV